MAGPERAGETIYIVDDEEAVRDALGVVLTMEGYGIEGFGDGESFLAATRRTPPSAVFLDVHMPEIEGMALARLLRRFADPPGVVFLTGHPDAAVEAFEVQALDFIVKPVGRDRLDAALQRVEDHARHADDAAPRDEAGAATVGGPDVVAVDNPKGGGKRLVRLLIEPALWAQFCRQ